LEVVCVPILLICVSLPDTNAVAKVCACDLDTDCIIGLRPLEEEIAIEGVDVIHGRKCSAKRVALHDFGSFGLPVFKVKGKVKFTRGWGFPVNELAPLITVNVVPPGGCLKGQFGEPPYAGAGVHCKVGAKWFLMASWPHVPRVKFEGGCPSEDHGLSG
jgi:hypothetical protein